MESADYLPIAVRWAVESPCSLRKTALPKVKKCNSKNRISISNSIQLSNRNQTPK